MCVVFLVVLLISAFGSSHAVDVARCSNGTGTKNVTFTPYNDGVVGRYLFELCMDMEPETTSWNLLLSLYDGEYKCTHPPFHGIHYPGKIHSTYEQTIVIDGNCSHVCVNTTFDLIFSGCYSMKSSFVVGGYTRYINYTYFNIKNNYTKEDFIHNNALVDILNHDDENLTIVWHTGVPFVDFDVTVCKIINTTLAIEVEDPNCLKLDSSACAAPSSLEIRCPAALADHCYSLVLTMHAAWTHGLLRQQGLASYTYCKERPRVEGPAGAAGAAGGAAWPWALGAALLAAGAAAAARLACRSRRARRLHKAVLHEWRVQTRGGAAGPAVPAVPAVRRHVLLLYAREGPAAARACAALRELLEACPDTQVHDLFSAATLAAAAAAPAAWLRGLLARADVAVLLLQTPALACLYQAQLRAGLQLRAPLLGRRVQYRAPQFGDSLLQYAVQLAAEAARAHGDYRKYYLATLSALPTEALPALVPYRRYALPGAAALLLRDVCGAAPAPAPLAAFRAAAAEYAAHAADHPAYLMDELVCV